MTLVQTRCETDVYPLRNLTLKHIVMTAEMLFVSDDLFSVIIP